MTANRQFHNVTQILHDLENSLTDFRESMNEMVGLVDRDSTHQQWKNFRPEGELHFYSSNPQGGWYSQPTMDAQALKK